MQGDAVGQCYNPKVLAEFFNIEPMTNPAIGLSLFRQRAPYRTQAPFDTDVGTLDEDFILKIA